MGSSAWYYFVPYQPEINKALQELRQKVFEDGSYYQPTRWYKSLYDSGIIDDTRLREKLNEFKTEEQPKTPEILIQLRGHVGTHSIIDVEKISSSAGDRTISPLTPGELATFFMTDKPTHEMVASKIDELQVLRDGWQGIYVMVYKDGVSSEILFAGNSGD